MCEKYNELDNKIARYTRLAFQITDQRTLDGIARLIKQMTADKAGDRPKSKICGRFGT